MVLREAVIAVTYKCNCRCSMCNIWQAKDFPEIPAVEYAKLPSTLRTINVTGGEPFLRKDLTDVVRSISTSAPDSRLVFSSNGLLTETIVETLTAIRLFHQKVGVGISIDGTQPTHDQIRGMPGCYTKAVRTVESLKDTGFKDLRLGMTISEANADEIIDVFRLSRDLGVEFTATVAHNSEVYFRRMDNLSFESYGNRLRGLSSVIDSQVHSKKIKDWFRAYHLQGLLSKSIRDDYAGHCSAGRRYVFIAPNGDVFPCSVMNFRIGNLAEVKTWGEIFDSDAGRKVETEVRDCSRDCWMVCNTRSLIAANPFKAMRWILGRKLAGKAANGRT